MSEETTDQTTENVTPDPDVEAKAREMGWKPKEEWDGDSERWMPAEEFVERNERLQKRADSIAQAEIKRLEGRISELQATINDLGQHMKKADQRAYQKALDDLKAQQREAVEQGDTKAYEQAERQMENLKKDVEAADEAGGQQARPDADFRAWHAENAWYDDDVEATVYADQIAPVVARKTGYKGRALYDAVAQEVKKKFPDKFGNPRRSRPQAVENAGTSSGQAKTLWDQVPREDRAAFKRFVEQGLYKDTKEDREKFADIYLNG